MAIVMRRGPWNKFDPSKLLQGEWAIVTSGCPDTTDGRAIYHCLAAGVVKRMLTYEEATDEMRAILDVAFEDLEDDFTEDVTAATTAANAAASSASSAATSANSAAANANAEAAKVHTYVQQELAAHPEWTTTVQDGAVTDAKLYQGKGGILDRVARLWHRLDNLLTSTPAESDALAVSDAAKTPLAGLALYGRSTQDGTPTPEAPVPIESVEAPNLLPRQCSTQTINGVTFTVNADGSVHAQGTASANTVFYYTPDTTVIGSLPVGTMTLSGCPAGGGASTWKLDFRYQTTESPSGGSFVTDYGSGATFTRTQVTYINITRIVVYSGVTIDATFRPQINLGSTACPYVPYGCAGLWAKRTSDATQQSVTPIPLQGHALRSLPDGTRDEVTVDQYGHAVLTQRVGSVTFDGSSEENWRHEVSASYGDNFYIAVPDAQRGSFGSRILLTCCPASARNFAERDTGYISNSGNLNLPIGTTLGISTVANFQTWLASNLTTVLYALATPVTIDLGTVDPVALQGPDMTAQAVPTAPFALTYERDLNVTLARLEAAIADAATA